MVKKKNKERKSKRELFVNHFIHFFCPSVLTFPWFPVSVILLFEGFHNVLYQLFLASREVLASNGRVQANSLIG